MRPAHPALAVALCLCACAGEVLDQTADELTPADDDLGSVERELARPAAVCPPGSAPAAPTLHSGLGELTTHDPAAIAVPSPSDPTQVTYYVFSTGEGIAIRSSTDLKTWQTGRRVFEPCVDATGREVWPSNYPYWARAAFPGAKPTNVWSPTVAFFGGRYHLYYAISTFGNRQVLVGHATNATSALDDSSAWVDEGHAIYSTRAVPAALIPSNLAAQIPALITPDGPSVLVRRNASGFEVVRLTLGGNWGGVFQLRVTPSTGLPITTSLVHLATHFDGRYNTIEGADVVEHGGYFYLFVNWDNCCERWDSNWFYFGTGDPQLKPYRIVVGRSASPTGPYVARDGTSMQQGHATPYLPARFDRYLAPGGAEGVGGPSVIETHVGTVMVFHAYDVDHAENPNVRRIRWDSAGWPLDDGRIP